MAVFDTSELHALTAKLHDAARRIPAEVRPIVSRGALNIKRQIEADLRASTHFKGVGPVTYDMRGNAAYSEAEIGPETGGQVPGDLYHIAVFGTSRGGGTVPDPQRALEAEAPRFERALGDLYDGLL